MKFLHHAKKDNAGQKSALLTLFLFIASFFLQNFNVAGVHPAGAFQASDQSGTYKIRKVVLDAGHGGKDPGCIGVGKTYEKHNTLAIVLALGAKIEANYPDVQVIYTRDTDVFIELKERAGIANRNNADLFISVHCNALSVSSASGTETYVMGLHTAAHNLEVAKRENASIYLEDNYKKDYEGYDPNSPEAHILGSVWQSAYLEQSILLASKVQHHATQVANRENRGVKQAGFLVLRETAMPSILVEAGYLTNSREEAFLVSDEGRDKMAESIFRAFKDYKNTMEGSTAAQPQAIGPNPPKAKSVVQTPVTKPVTQQTKNTPSNIPAKNQFRIQLLTWPSRLDLNTGKLSLLSNVTEEKVGSEYRYFVGTFASQEAAQKMLPELKNLGFKTATVVQK